MHISIGIYTYIWVIIYLRDNKFRLTSTINCQRVEMSMKTLYSARIGPSGFHEFDAQYGAPKYFKFIDIWSLEPDQLDNIRFNPKSCRSLDPYPARLSCICRKIEHGISKESILWLKQTINNACGLYAILHCVCNTLGTEEIGMISCFTPCGIYIN